ncbi:MAG: hypothetical protein ABW098_08220 [Candidatus Thiodiazotropha sp.]
MATSNAFSVSAIPQNWSMAFSCLIPNAGCASMLPGNRRGFKVQDSWESDSGVVSDLNETAISEIVEVKDSGGSLSGAGLQTSAFLPGNLFSTDEHSVPAHSSTGYSVLSQVSKFNDRRSSATDIPMKNSGYRIGHFILPIAGSGFLGFFADYEITTIKFGSRQTAGGVTSNAGSGSVTRTQRI